MKKYLSLAAFVVVFEAVSFLIGMATRAETAGWYQTLAKPPLNPPDMAFPVMWTILYALIAAAGWRLWHERHNERHNGLLWLFAVYMVFNWAWMFIFFGAHMILGGLLWIIVMNMIAVLLIIRSWQLVRAAALLMIAPTIWTFFAMYLNGGIWVLNG